jgi:uncharacterized protein DUF1579
MRNTRWTKSVASTAAAALSCLASAGCVATPEGAAGRSHQAERKYTQQEEMDAWMKVAVPGPEHQRMAADVGEWSVDSKMWMDPSAPPQESTGRAWIHMIHDGRFQVMDYESSMMGKTFRGMGVTGYDLVERKYVSSWCDSMSTMIMHSEGNYDAEGKALTMTASFRDPLGRSNRMREVMTRTDADHFVFEMYGTCGSSPEVKMMELRYTRKR